MLAIFVVTHPLLHNCLLHAIKKWCSIDFRGSRIFWSSTAHPWQPGHMDAAQITNMCLNDWLLLWLFIRDVGWSSLCEQTIYVPQATQIEYTSTCSTPHSIFSQNREKEKADMVSYLLLCWRMLFVGVRYRVRQSSGRAEGFGIYSQMVQSWNLSALHLLEERCRLAILRFHHHPLPAVVSRWMCVCV